METQFIPLPSITLEWSEWFAWDDLKVDGRQGGVNIPNNSSGVYEAKYANANDRLTIGKASNLRHRIRQCLVKGKGPHSSGKKIRAVEDCSQIVVRWAVTDRPAAVEEELHRLYRDKHGGPLPKYVEHT